MIVKYKFMQAILLMLCENRFIIEKGDYRLFVYYLMRIAALFEQSVDIEGSGQSYEIINNQASLDISSLNIICYMDIQHFFAQLIRRRGPEKFTDLEELKAILTDVAPKVSKRALEFAQALFEFQNIRTVDLFTWTYPIENPSQSPICSKIMSEGMNSVSFRCFDCMESSSSCICGDCFVEGDHKGHNYLQYGSVNGCCDCGNAEAWNQKGFCKTHASITKGSYSIAESTRKAYIAQGLFLIYIYLYLVKKPDAKKSLLEEYGNQLFKYQTSNSHQNYEMKLLACELMLSKFPEHYPMVPFKDNNCLEIFFRLPALEVRAYPELIHWLFEVFPVEDFRKRVLKEYFNKMRRLEDRMVSQHPISGLNFQYLSCVKLIISMIKQKEIEPLQLAIPNAGLLESEEIAIIPNLYKKLYEDLDYINNMKSAREYHKLHLELTNITQLAGYREFSKSGSKVPLSPSILPQFNVDEMFVKTLAKFLSNILDDKDLIAKGLTELFHFIFNAGENLVSQAQERAFAMLVLGYLDGDLNKLLSQQARNDFMKTLVVSSGQFKMMLQTIIRATIQSNANMARVGPSDKSSYEQYFLRVNAQRNLPHCLDLIFHKILLMMSQGVCSYADIVLDWYKAKWQKLESHELQVPREKADELINDLKVVLGNVNSIIEVDLDETIVSNVLKIDCKTKVFEIYSRIITTYKQLNIKELKNLCLEVINKEELFEEFVTGYAFPEKGKLRLKQQVRPLEYIVYRNIFKKYSAPLPENQVSHLTGEETYPRFKHIKVFHPELISIAIQKCMEMISYLVDEANESTQALLTDVSAEILKLYLWDRSHQEIKYFLCTLLNPSLRGLFPKNLIQQITLIEKKQEELAQDLEKIKMEEAEQFRLKREKIINKRKLKEEMMKKNQQSMLSKFNKEMLENKQVEETKGICIYCKEVTNEPLSLISYVGITNLIERSVVPQPLFHYFFSTCGHRIHGSCYIQVNQQEMRKFCLLCKQEANILVPELTNWEERDERTREIAQNFVANIISSILDQNQIEDGKIGKFQNNIFDENLQLFVVSLAKEIAYNALHDFDYFKKYVAHLYRQLLEILNLLNKQSLSQVWDSLKQRYQATEVHHPLERLSRYIQLRFQERFSGYPCSEEQLNILEVSADQQQQVIEFFAFLQGKSTGQQIHDLKYINPSNIFVKIPDTLTELHHYMGQCKLCPNITNNIFLCLVCGWSACIKCVKRIIMHVSEEHIDGAVIMGCSTGTVKYFKASRIFEDASIYENYLGLSFSEAETYAEFGKADKYILNRQKQAQLHKLMLHYQVHQKIQINSGNS